MRPGSKSFPTWEGTAANESGAGRHPRDNVERGKTLKIFFLTVLVLNFLFEALAGVSLIFGPQGVLSDFRPADGMWAMNYGFAALAVASVVFWTWPHRTNARVVGTVLGFLTTFHFLLAVSLAIPGNQFGAMMTHGIMGVLCLFLLTQRGRWCEVPSASG